MLAKRWLGTTIPIRRIRWSSHLRLVSKIASGYRGYGLPLAELISEGNIGLMQAVKRFDPSGASVSRLTPCGGSGRRSKSILHSWSLVKIGTAAQKKLFFNLRKLKGQMKPSKTAT